jgi:putative resolvase
MRLLSIGKPGRPAGRGGGDTATCIGRATDTCRADRWRSSALREALRSNLDESATPIGKTVCYARVSSHDQAEQLKTQAARYQFLCCGLDCTFLTQTGPPKAPHRLMMLAMITP